MQVYNDELKHFGKLGMKWGHHKTPSTFANSPKLLKKDAIDTIKFQNHDIKAASKRHYSRSDRKIQKEAYKNVMAGKVLRKQTGKSWNFSNEDLKTIGNARIEYGKRQTAKTMLTIGLSAVSMAATLAGTNYLADMNIIRR